MLRREDSLRLDTVQAPERTAPRRSCQNPSRVLIVLHMVWGLLTCGVQASFHLRFRRLLFRPCWSQREDIFFCKGLKQSEATNRETQTHIHLPTAFQLQPREAMLSSYSGARKTGDVQWCGKTRFTFWVLFIFVCWGLQNQSVVILFPCQGL